MVRGADSLGQRTLFPMCQKGGATLRNSNQKEGRQIQGFRDWEPEEKWRGQAGGSIRGVITRARNADAQGKWPYCGGTKDSASRRESNFCQELIGILTHRGGGGRRVAGQAELLKSRDSECRLGN